MGSWLLRAASWILAASAAIPAVWRPDGGLMWPSEVALAGGREPPVIAAYFVCVMAVGLLTLSRVPQRASVLGTVRYLAAVGLYIGLVITTPVDFEVDAPESLRGMMPTSGYSVGFALVIAAYVIATSRPRDSFRGGSVVRVLGCTAIAVALVPWFTPIGMATPADSMIAVVGHHVLSESWLIRAGAISFLASIVTLGAAALSPLRTNPVLLALAIVGWSGASLVVHGDARPWLVVYGTRLIPLALLAGEAWKPAAMPIPSASRA